MLRLGTLILIGLTVASCSGPIEGQLTGECSDLSIADTDYFDSVMTSQFFDVHCTVCHSRDLPEGRGPDTRRGAPRSFSYDTHSGAVLSPDATWERIADRTMPPMGREVDEAEAALIAEWLNCVVAQQELDGDDDDDSAR